jgi:predicted RNA-binding Zn-ribbon protein involved in translation (DUF1610 family)
MNKQDSLEYLCPHCGIINSFPLHALRDMYQEQVETCTCCGKDLSLTAADGIAGQINLVVGDLDHDIQAK